MPKTVSKQTLIIRSMPVVCAIFALGSPLLGCGPFGGQSTADLVQRGDAKACAAADVYSTLHDILTKPITLNTGAGDFTPMFGRANQLMAKASLKFDATTLDAVDAATHSITCSAQMSGQVGDQTFSGQRVAYKVQPSASSGQIVVTVNDADDAQTPIVKAAAIVSQGQLGAADEPAAANAPAPPTVPSPAASDAGNVAGDGGELTHTRFGNLSVDDDHELLLNGKIVKPVIDSGFSLDLGEVFEFGDRDLLVATDNTGGTACLEQIMIIVVDASGAHSPGEYGTCAEIGDVKRVGNTLVTKMPGFKGPDEPLAERTRAAKELHTFVFTSDGRATDNGELVKPS